MTKRLLLGGLIACLLVFTALGLEMRRYVPVRKHLGLAAATAVAADVQEGPIRKYHEPVRPKRLDAWEIIGPGGGGTFYEPSISPHDPNLVFATTDMRECYVTEDGGRTWRQFNLRWSCRFTFDPKLPNRVYALAGTTGLWRSDDRGHTWTSVYPDPAAATELFYMDDESDIATRWTHGWVQQMRAFAVDPEDSNLLYALIADELTVSKDAGKTWQTIAKKVKDANDILVDPTSPKASRRLFILSRGGAIAIWDGARYTSDLKPPQGSPWFFGLAWGMDSQPTIYTANDFARQDGVYTGGGIIRTHDGHNWETINTGILAMVAKETYPEFTAIATSFLHPETLYASVYHVNLPNDSKRYYGILKTSDGGKTWAPVRMEADQIAGNMHESWISYRFGPDWGEQPQAIGVGPNDPNLVYTTDLGRIMKSTNGGKTWDAVYSQGTENGYTTTGLDVTTCYGIHFDPFDPKRMFISYTDIGLFRSEDGGKSWISSTTKGVPRQWQNTTYWVEFDPQVKGKMWAVMSGTHDLPRHRMFHRPGSTARFHGGVVVSEDGGRSWKLSNKGMPDMAPTDIRLDPKSPVKARVLYVVGFGRGIYKSVDGGETWTAKNNGLPANEVLTWRMAIGGDGTLYVVTIRRSEDNQWGNDQDGWLFRSRDGAETWERVALPDGLNGPMGITVDPQNPARLYLSAWGRYKLYGAGVAAMGGVFLSTDGGAHWTNVLDASQRIYDVTVDPRDPDLVYATGFEASAWRSADRGLTWKRIRGYNFKDGHRVIPDPYDRSKIYITTFGSSVWHGPATGDPDAVEDIVSPRVFTFNAQSTGKIGKAH